MTYNKIDYTKLNDKIVHQAYTSYDKEEFHRLIEEKFERAKALHEANEAFARGRKYRQYK